MQEIIVYPAIRSDIAGDRFINKYFKKPLAGKKFKNQWKNAKGRSNKFNVKKKYKQIPDGYNCFEFVPVSKKGFIEYINNNAYTNYYTGLLNPVKINKDGSRIILVSIDEKKYIEYTFDTREILCKK
jgi:hypothetical protein